MAQDARQGTDRPTEVYLEAHDKLRYLVRSLQEDFLKEKQNKNGGTQPGKFLRYLHLMPEEDWSADVHNRLQHFEPKKEVANRKEVKKMMQDEMTQAEKNEVAKCRRMLTAIHNELKNGKDLNGAEIINWLEEDNIAEQLIDQLDFIEVRQEVAEELKQEENKQIQMPAPKSPKRIKPPEKLIKSPVARRGNRFEGMMSQRSDSEDSASSRNGSAASKQNDRAEDSVNVSTFQLSNNDQI